MKNVLKLLKKMPGLYGFLRYGIYARLRSTGRKRIFLNIYRTRGWDDQASLSGPGSSLATTENLRAALPDLLIRLRAQSFLDLPCGDFQWMKEVPLGVVTYIGGDIVEPLILKNREYYGNRGDFIALDLLRDPLPKVDVIFCRDCLVHLSFREGLQALANIRRTGPKYLLSTTFPELAVNADTVTPYWRAINLERPPFNLPEPISMIKDHSDWQKNDRGKYLGVWRI